MPKILIVEDEPLIALTLEDMLSELGYEIAGNVSQIDEALSLADSLQLDGAILDVNLGRDRIDPVANRLAEKGCPIIFTTGGGRSTIPDGHGHRVFLSKPFRMEDLAAALRALAPLQTEV